MKADSPYTNAYIDGNETLHLHWEAPSRISASGASNVCLSCGEFLHRCGSEACILFKAQFLRFVQSVVGNKRTGRVISFSGDRDPPEVSPIYYSKNKAMVLITIGRNPSFRSKAQQPLK